MTHLNFHDVERIEVKPSHMKDSRQSIGFYSRGEFHVAEQVIETRVEMEHA